jgi:hypothetical protein
MTGESFPTRRTHPSRILKSGSQLVAKFRALGAIDGAGTLTIALITIELYLNKQLLSRNVHGRHNQPEHENLLGFT